MASEKSTQGRKDSRLQRSSIFSSYRGLMRPASGASDRRVVAAHERSSLGFPCSVASWESDT